MSILEEVMKEIYPHNVDIARDIARHDVTRWCLDNGIEECDVSHLYNKSHAKIGWVLRLAHLDDWILAKIKWA